MEWFTPQLSDGEWIRELVEKSEYMGSDGAFANIYLLRNKYNIKVARYKNFLLRYYEGHGSRRGYTFPLGTGDVYKAIKAIDDDASDRKVPLEFCFVTEEQKNILSDIYGSRMSFDSDDGDKDYIYLQQDLANLSGKAYHKKKNHVSKFMRSYPDMEFYEIGDNNVEDARVVEDAWYYDHLQSEDESALIEFMAIKDALDNFKELKLSGGIVYVNRVPVSMTIASRINDRVWDIHFEKSIGEYAMNGGFAVINQLFAKRLNSVTWINREEDINIEGLRKAKESYHPKMMLKKYSAKEVM